jgi:pimeloyl-ACP methyl ester carboxylesterase
VVYSVANAQEEIKLFVNSPDAKLATVEGGAHFLSGSHPNEVDKALVEFVTKFN